MGKWKHVCHHFRRELASFFDALICHSPYSCQLILSKTVDEHIRSDQRQHSTSYTVVLQASHCAGPQQVSIKTMHLFLQQFWQESCGYNNTNSDSVPYSSLPCTYYQHCHPLHFLNQTLGLSKVKQRSRKRSGR